MKGRTAGELPNPVGHANVETTRSVCHEGPLGGTHVGIQKQRYLAFCSSTRT